MKSDLRLSPLGTALRQATLVPQPARDSLEPLLEHLRDNVSELYNLEPEIIYLAFEIVRWQPDLNENERQALLLLLVISLINFRQGGTRLPMRDEQGRSFILEILRNLLDGFAPPGGSPAPNLVQEAIDALLESKRANSAIGGADEFKPLLHIESFLYHQRLLYLEKRFVEALTRLAKRAANTYPDALVEAKVTEVLQSPSMHGNAKLVLNPEQLGAIRKAVRSALTVISGGPGTGKTTIVVSILRVLRRLGVANEEIALAAPTGKAANRMGEAIKKGLETIATPALVDRELLAVPAPRTLHRLLGYAPANETFRHHENNRLAERVVIVDEGSMVDLFLMERLVRSLRDDACLVLLGDADQLPSVEAGAVLRDLLFDEGGQSPLGTRGVRLEKSHRQDAANPAGRNILAVAKTINEGRAEESFRAAVPDHESIAQRTSVASLAFDKVEFLATPDDGIVLEEFLERWNDEQVRGLEDYDRLVAQRYVWDRNGFAEETRRDLDKLFRHFERFRLLCLTHGFKAGTDRVNAHLHDRLELDTGAARSEFLPGEPIMMTKNDYEKGIFNGDQGLILRVSEERRERTMSVFPRAEGFAIFALDSLRGLIKHSYAMTIHKSQGSEFDHVAILLPEKDLPILTREILYTAVTRSKKSVTILGDRQRFEAGARKRIQRFSGIADALAARLGKGE